MRLKKKMTCAVLFLATLMSLSRLLAATTISVPSSTYPTIQAGINAAVPGATVSVAEGTYSENIVIGSGKDGVIVQGAGGGKTFLNLTTLGGTAVTFNNVTSSTLRGFTIRKADVGIKADKSKPYVTNNIFQDNVNAFENRSSFSRVINNTFYGNTRAVFSNSSSTLKNNIVSKSGRYAITGSRGGSITYNLFHENTLGNFSGISAPSVTFNNITGNPLFVNVPTVSDQSFDTTSISDFHLRAGSPAINRGDPSIRDSFDNSTSDIGVYGGPKADITPTKVRGVAAVSAKDKVTISWNKNLAYNITGYKVYYGTVSNNLASTASVFGNSTTFISPTISSDTRYYFAVTAVAANDVPLHESEKSSLVFGAIDTVPPTAPTNLRAAVGDRRLFLSWDAATDNESGIKGYKVYYGASSETYLSPIDVGNHTSYELAGLTNGVTYFIAVSAYDYAENEGPKSTEVSEAPQEVRGILGLKDTGGCFIATAAYGSYEERHVKILREFRDRYLLTNIPGSAFVSFYYKVSPPIADFIRDSETLKALVRVALLPLIGFAWVLINHPVLCLGFIGYGLWVICFKPITYRLSPITCRLTSYVSLLIIFLLSVPAVTYGNERNGLSVGLSYGQLEPASDEWKEIYDDDRISTYRVSLGYRFHPTVSVEIGGGYLTKDGKGKTVTGKETGVKTTFYEAPVDITLLYRMNYFDDQIIVPYIGGGVSYNYYWEKVKDGKELKGGMRGHHATGGLQLLLDNIDRRSAFDLEEDYGIENTYLTIGATHSVIDDFGKEDVDLGGWNYNVGLLFEF